ILMRPELYVTAAALASGLFVGLTLAGMAVWPAAIIAAIAGFVLRGLAITRGLALPAYRD
ncbi:MAG: trimeric intracellular cation channel family protein, partial [Sphingomicrobium sp.]